MANEEPKYEPARHKRGHPSADDRARMTKLYAEVVTRIEEMARITARTLNLSSQSPVQRATLIIPSGEEPGTPQVPSTIIELLSVGGGTICWQDPPGLCCGGPCPCTVILAEYRAINAP